MSRDLSKKRLTQNEAMQRDANDKVRRTLANIFDSEDKISFICECSNETCSQHIDLTNQQFKQLHEDPREFVIKPDHETVAIEEVVVRNNDYFVVRKNVNPADFD